MKVLAELVGYSSNIEEALLELDRSGIVSRIWKIDHTVWKPEPAEITNRLGWLTIVEAMYQRMPDLESLAQEIGKTGFLYIVLLGMGGSSLGPEVLRSVFGKREGYPELIVLDSIDPDWILQVQERIDLNHTLFLVSSKSGSTIEPNVLYEYFRTQIESVVGKDQAGDHFVAVTDDGSSLAKRAQTEGFCRIFENPSDIGGRYSVLSFFGMVPAVLAGMDIARLLDAAYQMSKACTTSVPQDNPGCLLGTIMGNMALNGRDKLTLITSPGVSRFGLWVEQLIAESTGKEGKGIIPIVEEPLVDPQYYGEDRLFVFLRLKDDDNTTVDAAVKAITDSGQPMVTIEMQNKYDLGAEFFRWEFAVAVAGTLLGINPFNQPDVQKAKDATSRLLEVHDQTGSFPEVKKGLSLEALLNQVESSNYLSIMAYTVESSETEKIINQVRKRIIEKYSIATTFGYGPRFLHSTGQLHKGGPNSNLSLQLTVDHSVDFPVSGKPYTFGQLTNAQAAGDLEVLQQSGRRVARLHSAEGDFAVASQLAVHLSCEG